MKKTMMVMMIALLFTSISVPNAQGKENAQEKLLIVYTTADVNVFNKMIYIYALNSMKYGWWQEVEILTWGPSNESIANDEDLQKKIVQLQEAGVKISACKWCAESYGVAEKLIKLGVDVKYMGQPLTEMLKGDYKVLSF